ncbi:glutathione S-transferase theta-1 isoform X1 [Xenopus tropicalis]|uniref:glutathione transferase n=1 Tax=Xenopus tropicalis TaxID=8364 RepID=A0A8J1IRJ0_XENTR|nr:glutathione S-transferase theta-1 isoform X1 [Xenopus tropicalis]
MSSSELTLYLDLLSQPCRSVYIFAKANRIPFNYCKLQLLKAGEHLTQEFGKVSVLHKVPALKDGNFTMAESTAMLLYLARKYKTPNHWYPSDLQKRARVDEYLAWQHTNTRPHGSKVFWTKCVSPTILGKEVPSEKMNAVMAEFVTTMNNFEEKFLGNKPFIAGDEISVADLVAIVEIMQVIASGVNVFEERPKLGSWKQRLVEAVGEELFLEAHEWILSFSKQKFDPPPPELLQRLRSNPLYNH